MPVGALRALVLEANLAAHGVAATVTRPYPDDTPIQTRVIWVTEATEGGGGGRQGRRELRRVLVLSAADVPTVPKNTVIVASGPDGSAAQTWRVDAIERVGWDLIEAVVVAESEA